jgi:hypothetical protein
MSAKRARKIKIRIVANGKKIWMPGIPFWLIRSSWRIAKIFIGRSDPDNRIIRELNIKDILHELSLCGRSILADIDVKNDNTKVFIELR